MELFRKSRNKRNIRRYEIYDTVIKLRFLASPSILLDREGWDAGELLARLSDDAIFRDLDAELEQLSCMSGEARKLFRKMGRDAGILEDGLVRYADAVEACRDGTLDATEHAKKLAECMASVDNGFLERMRRFIDGQIRR